MIRHRWHDAVAVDKAILKGEWAGVRVSNGAERNAIGAGRHDTCNTFVFLRCGSVLRLIVTSEQRQPSFSKRWAMEARAKQAVKNNARSLPDAYSASILATVAALAPAALADLRRVQQTMRCRNCSCMMRPAGPLDPQSQQLQFVDRELAQSDFVKRNATHDR